MDKSKLRSAVIAKLGEVLAGVKRDIAYIEYELDHSESYEDVMEGQSAVRALSQVADRLREDIHALEIEE